MKASTYRCERSIGRTPKHFRVEPPFLKNEVQLGGAGENDAKMKNDCSAGQQSTKSKVRPKLLGLRARAHQESRKSGGGTPPKHEVQLGIRTGRPRGAPLGNNNRLKHGRYSARRIRRRKEVNVLLRNGRNLTRRIEMMARSRKALRRKMARSFTSPSVGRSTRAAKRARRVGGGAHRWSGPPPGNASHFRPPHTGGGENIRGSPRADWGYKRGSGRCRVTRALPAPITLP